MIPNCVNPKDLYPGINSLKFQEYVNSLHTHFPENFPKCDQNKLIEEEQVSLSRKLLSGLKAVEVVNDHD